MRVIVAGSRDIVDQIHVSKAIIDSGFEVTELVSGAARGVDRLGEAWARANKIPIRRFPAYWELHGRAAGYLRNEDMAEHSDALVAVWDGKSRGTGHMIDIARRYDLKVYVDQPE